MCVVSMISDHFQRTWPLQPQEIPDFGTIPQLDAPGWTKVRWDEYQELLRKAREYDAKTGQADCVDPKKQEFTDQVEKILKRKGLI